MTDDFASNGFVLPVEMLPAELAPHEERIRRIEIQVSHIVTQVNDMKDKMDETEAMIRKLIGEVGPALQEVIPMITAFTENPMVRMMLKGKGK